MTMKRWFFIYPILWLTLSFLIFTYFQGTRWPSLYGSFLHKASRLHIMTVHMTVGTLLLLALMEGFLFIKPENLSQFFSVRVRFHHLAHLVTLVSLCSGLVMETIEAYPNPLIQSHLYYALCVYAGLICFSAMCFWRRFGRWSCLAAICFALLVVNTAHLGGVIQKGLNFFYK